MNEPHDGPRPIHNVAGQDDDKVLGTLKGSLGGGVTEAAAHDLDGDAAVDQLAGVGVTELVDADPGTGSGAVLLPPAVRRVVRKRPAPAVDGPAEQRARGVPVRTR
jgi:hypothetical protein